MIQMSDDGNVFILNNKVYTRTGTAASWTVATGASNVNGILSGNGLVVLEADRVLQASDQTWSSVTITTMSTIGGSMNRANYPTPLWKVLPVGLSTDGTKAITLFLSASSNSTYRYQIAAGFMVKVNNVWTAGPTTNIAYVQNSNSSFSGGFAEMFNAPCQFASADLGLVAFKWQQYRMNGSSGGYASYNTENLFGLKTGSGNATGYVLTVGPATTGVGPGAGDTNYGNFATHVSRDGTTIYRSNTTSSSSIVKIPVSSSLVLGSSVNLDVSSSKFGGNSFNDQYAKISQLGNVQNADTSFARNYVDIYNAPAPLDSANGLIIPLRNTSSGNLFAQATFNASGVPTLVRAGPTNMPTAADTGSAYNGFYMIRGGTNAVATSGDAVRVYKLN